jgi:hypothetical protein
MTTDTPMYPAATTPHPTTSPATPVGEVSILKICNQLARCQSREAYPEARAALGEAVKLLKLIAQRAEIHRETREKLKRECERTEVQAAHVNDLLSEISYLREMGKIGLENIERLDSALKNCQDSAAARLACIQGIVKLAAAIQESAVMATAGEKEKSTG